MDKSENYISQGPQVVGYNCYNFLDFFKTSITQSVYKLTLNSHQPFFDTINTIRLKYSNSKDTEKKKNSISTALSVVCQVTINTIKLRIFNVLVHFIIIAVYLYTKVIDEEQFMLLQVDRSNKIPIDLLGNADRSLVTFISKSMIKIDKLLIGTKLQW
ncbi:hypothetical protein J3Q64DRAFT_1699525 [Phycomyces blakesleeanus]|uniref:Uncharacterized protein n=2 Tax=Phycomyces blakesleeanus TaxID=4837 RepID=A0A167P3W7_PHYB8|nr:hypothetical protein PHYBLDRAFT_165686 [Phycomyces blakesleeanus NRRL 1555(-)]OAD77199.1 hypothetical protein PHYBLDRAFT_165686 [Phycomyces blakesleeanus NRRL 1555(-)]|eukprot:XP_018295239.1 hypothetical protein PHYBLDRAFT_165686 [Phycomyces blakesleeanus NRRL 1555(-)]